MGGMASMPAAKLQSGRVDFVIFGGHWKREGGKAWFMRERRKASLSWESTMCLQVLLYCRKR